VRASKEVLSKVRSKVRYLPQRLNTVQNILIPVLCSLKESDIDGALIALRESYEYLKLIIKDVEDVVKTLEDLRGRG
jgi:hypothetical protein